MKKFQLPYLSFNPPAQKNSVFSEYQSVANYVFLLVWIYFACDFALWWFVGTEIVNIPLFIIVTLSVFWLPLLHLYFFFFALRQCEFPNSVHAPLGRVALITTKVHSESVLLLKRTLLAMKQQVKLDWRFIDVWLLDEDPSEEMFHWCKDNKIYVASRKGHKDYNRTTYPGKAKTKEGNVRYFLDHWGYDMYDFLIQFDADHAPEPDFAFEVLKEFADPEVGYVATPSIVDGNIQESWTVKARNYWEAATHGPVQTGTYNGFAPMMFGSHYSHRVKALKEIGGIGPEIAEDHTTTLLYNAHGWKGGFARHAIAHGYGAVGITDSMIQEYQWAMVGMRAALLITPLYFLNLRPGVKFQFLVWEFWYPLLTLVSLASLAIPLYALFFADPIVRVQSEDFLYRYAWINGVFIAFGFWMRYLKHFRPHYSLHLSFETFIFQYLQFPWIVIGWVQGLWQVITKSEPKKITITDKDERIKHIPFIAFLPHYVLVAISWIPLIWYQEAGEAKGYIFFVLLVMLSYVTSLFVGTYLSLLENLQKIQHGKRLTYIMENLATIVAVIAVSLVSSFLFGKALDEYYQLSLPSILTSFL